jgi:hypothetical protein
MTPQGRAPQVPAATLEGQQVVELPAPLMDGKVPWPCFTISPVQRQAISGGHLQLHTLSSLPGRPTVLPSSSGLPPQPPQRPQPLQPPKGLQGTPIRMAGPAVIALGVTPAPIVHQPPAAPIPQPPKGLQGTPLRMAGPVATGVPSTPHGASPAAIPHAAAAPVRAAVAPRANAPAPVSRNAPVDHLAHAALVLGWLGFLFGLFTGIPAIVCGRRALKRADPIWTPARMKRRARWGLTLGYITTTLSFVLLLVILVLAHQ